MSYIADNDKVILMDNPTPLVPGLETSAWTNEHWLRPDDLKRLRDVGCQTSLSPVWWHAIEPERGARNWAHVDEIVERTTKAGLKVLLNTYHGPPPPGILPEEWYQKYEDGSLGTHFSYQNDEAQAYEHAFIRELVDRYDGQDVKCINSMQCDGETLLPLQSCFYDAASLRSHGPEDISANSPHTQSWIRERLIETMLEQHDALGGNEMWFNMHLVIKNPWCGSEHIESIYRAFRERRPGVELWSIQYTYFPHGEIYRKIMGDRMNRHGLQVIGGAEHCHGIADNTPRAIEDGVRMLIGPTHAFTKKKRVDDQMLQVIADAIKAMT